MKLPRRPTPTDTDGDRRPESAAQRVLRDALAQAVLAPSSHNTQPWRFRLLEDRVAVYADRTRALPVVDPDDRALVISCGAAVAFLVVALRHAGHTGDVTLLPDPADPDLLALVGLGAAHQPDDQDRDRFTAIDVRHSHRGEFEDRAVPVGVLTSLADDAARFDVTVHTVTDPAAKQQMADLVAAGDRTQMADPRFRTELAAWMRSNYTHRSDGIPGHALGISGPASLVAPLFLRALDMGERQAARDWQLAATAPALLLLSTTDDTPAAWLATGQGLGTLLLTATAAGLAASFLNQPIETCTLGPRLTDQLGPSSGTPQLLLRLGYPATPDRPTPRRRLTDVLTAD